MSGLDIHPHSRHGTTLAVTLLSLLAVGAFVAGLNNQLIGGALPPFPAATATRAADAIPEATPAPDMQLATPVVAPRVAKPAPVDEEVAQADVAPPVTAAAAPAADPAASAPATEPAPAPAPPPATDNTEPPT